MRFAIVIVCFAATAHAQLDGGVPPDAGRSPDLDAGTTASMDAGAAEAIDAGAAEESSVLSELMGEDEDDGGLTIAPVRVQARAAPEVVETGGGVQHLDENAMHGMGYQSPDAIVSQIIGVYVRTEDGFGLRPNIGLRGTNPDRSSRVTLMEDSVLFAPAPYAAPAAYYFPLMQRFVGTDVYTGAATLPYGPYSVGGAIDFRTREIPRGSAGGVEVNGGSYFSGMSHLHYGASNDWGGFVFDGAYLRSQGFKHFDFMSGTDGNTGFDRGEFLLRGELHGSPMSGVYHRLEARFGAGLEDSHETYLGLTDADFRADPYRRYGASMFDHMQWWRTQGQLRYRVELGDSVEITTIAYRNDLSRQWHKVNGVSGAGTRELELELLNPGYAYDVLTGRAMVDPATGCTDSQFCTLIGTNARDFVSQGIQTDATIRATTGEFTHRLRVGVRLHYDQIIRTHTQASYLVIPPQVERVTPDGPLLYNMGRATALSSYIAWAFGWQTLTFTPSVRTEVVWTDYLETYPGNRSSSELRASVLPGGSISWQAIPELRFFGGIHRGFAPVAPGQPAQVQPEDALQYEAGADVAIESLGLRGHAAFFLNDYSNFLVQSAFGEGTGALVSDEQANAGRVLVGGLEAQVTERARIGEVTIPMRLAYTFTYTSMLNSFTSNNLLYPLVRPGDHLPYVPEHQLSLQGGVEMAQWGVSVTASYTSPMWERAAQGAPDPVSGASVTDPLFLLDANAYVQPFPNVRFYLRGENLTNTQAIVSRRPFGARPNRPLLIQLGMRVDF